MTLSRTELEREAAATGFQPEPLEKVVRLFELLQSLKSHPFLKNRFVLKGGTALNLFWSDVPRLSVDLDLNYIGAADRDTMLKEKPTMDQAVTAVCGRLGIQVMRVPGEHAGGKWRLSYDSAMGRTGTLELDLGCDSGTASYSSVEEGFGSGVLNVIRLTSIDGMSCPP